MTDTTMGRDLPDIAVVVVINVPAAPSHIPPGKRVTDKRATIIEHL